jgi:hypothetical protein
MEIIRARSALTPYFNDFQDRTPYHFKRHAIQNCLYGVDIDPGAVEIAKLRLWLSLVVDEEDVKQIKPLPNLLYKIVTGNSLLGVEKTLFNEKLFRRLEGLKPRYFDEPDKEKKIRYKQQIDDTIHEITKGQEIFDFKIYFSEVFHNKGGFDVVIGNPPYLRIQNIDKNDARVLKRMYASAIGKFDIYVLFVEKSFTLIAPDGLIVFIHPHRFLTADYGRGLKAFLDRKKGLKSAIFFGVDQIFETGTTYTGVFAYSENNESFTFKHAKAKDFARGDFEKRFYTASGIHWNISTEGLSSSDLIEKLRGQPVKLSAICRGIFQGIVTVGDDIFVLKGKRIGRKFIGWSEAAEREVELEAEIVKPMLKGEHIQRYRPLASDIWIFYPHYQDPFGKTRAFTETEMRDRFPKAFDYIKRFKRHLIEKKIQYKTPSFTFDEGGWYPDAGGYSIILKRKSKDDYLYLLGVLNSALLWYFIRGTSNPYNNSYYYFKTKYLEPFSLPESQGECQVRIVELVKQIQALQRQQRPVDTSSLEKDIDELVYALYGLTEKEIAMVKAAAQ